MIKRLTGVTGLQVCNVLGMRAQWCHCACCPGPEGWWRPATAVGPVMCGPQPVGQGSAALLSQATLQSKPPTAPQHGVGSTLQASS